MLHETKVLLDRAGPLQRAGQWLEAIEVCREAFRQSIASCDLETLGESVLRTGFCYRQMGEKELAVEYLELSLTLSTLNSDQGRASRALNGLATVYHMHGELEEAS